MATAIERFDERARRTFESLGRTVVYVGELRRHPVYTRFLHWMVALFFFLALFSGFGIYLPWLFRWFTPIFGGGPLARALHPWFGIFFVFFFGLQMLNWLQPMMWTPADTNWMRNLRGIVSGKETLEPPTPDFSMPGRSCNSGKSLSAVSCSSLQASSCGPALAPSAAPSWRSAMSCTTCRQSSC